MLCHLREVWDAVAQEVFDYENQARYHLSAAVHLLGMQCEGGKTKVSQQEQIAAQRMKQMLRFVEEHYAEELNVERISDCVALSESACLRSFRQLLGITPIQYVKQYRIEKAAELLLSTSMKIGEIGADCGFSDTSYLQRPSGRSSTARPESTVRSLQEESSLFQGGTAAEPVHRLKQRYKKENRKTMQRSLTKGPITGSILLFALPLMLAYLLSATPLGVIGIWLSVPIGWAAGRCQLALDTIKKEAVNEQGGKEDGRPYQDPRRAGAQPEKRECGCAAGQIVGVAGVSGSGSPALRWACFTPKLPPVSGRTFHLYAPPHDAGGKGIGGRSAVCSGCTGTASAARCAGHPQHLWYRHGTAEQSAPDVLPSFQLSLPAVRPLAGTPALPWRQKSRCSARSAVPACARFPLKNLLQQSGACRTCSGTGMVMTVDESTLVPDDSLTIDEGAVARGRADVVADGGYLPGDGACAPMCPSAT